MKVLFLTNIPSPYRADFFNELGKLCDLTVTFEGLNSTERDSKWVGQKASNYKPVFLKGKRTKTDQFICFGIVEILKQKWDAIIIGNYSSPTSMLAISYMNIFKIKFIIQADGGLIPDKENIIKFLIKKHYISSSDYWMSSGQATTDYLVHYGAYYEKCYVFPFTSLWEMDLYNANKLRLQDRASLREKLNIAEDYVILSVGRFSYNEGYGKGYDMLMRVAEKLPANAGIYIVGDDPTNEFLKWKEDKKLDHVHFVGFKLKEELAYYYAAADIFVLMTRADVWGLVINEAMSFGLPVITTNKCVAGLELVKDGDNGYIVPVDEDDVLFEKIDILMKNPDLSNSYRIKSLNKIQNYTLENMAKVNYKILEDNIQR